MKLRDPHKIIQKPIITEKASNMRGDTNTYLFYVHPNATKKDIKSSIEALFSVDVIGIRTMNVSGKPRRRGQFVGNTPARKKAIVKLKAGQTIPVFEGLV